MPRYLETGQLILQDALFRAGELTTLTGVISDYLDEAKKFVQRTYFDVLEYAPWPWALKDPPGILTVYAKKTNTATVTRDSTAVTLGAAIASSVAGWWFQVDSQLVPYRITAHTAGATTLTLDAPYNEAAGTLITCTIFKDEYSLASDCLKPWAAWNRNKPTDRIDVIGMGEMRDRFTNRNTPAINARIMAVVKSNKVRIRPWPETDNITIEYDYTAYPSADLTFDGVAATDTPVVPLYDRQVLSDVATAQLHLLKNDPRAQELMNLVTGKLGQMVTNYLSGTKPRLYVKPGQGVWR